MVSPQLTCGPAGRLGLQVGWQQVPLKLTSPAGQQTTSWQLVPWAQQSSTPPQPSKCPHPVFAKSAQVLGTHGWHALPTQTSPDPHGAQDADTPHPKSTAPQPGPSMPASARPAQVCGVQHALPTQTSPDPQGAQEPETPHPRSTDPQPPVKVPASTRAAHVCGVQQAPLVQTSLPPQLPQLTEGPQPLLTWPQVAPLHEGGAHALQAPATHVVVPVHPPHETFPLPQAFAIVPHFEPASVSHSTGSFPQTPLKHCSPLGHEHGSDWPHPLVTVPQRWVWALGVHVTFAQDPASFGGADVHTLSTHDSPVGHPPHTIGTPHESTPISPQFPVHAFAWQLWVDPEVTQTLPPVHAFPHATVTPVHGLT